MSAAQTEPMDTPAQGAKRQEKLDRAAGLAYQIVKDAHEAGRSMLRAETEGERKTAAGQSVRASKVAFEVAGLLVDAGAVIPEWKAQAEKGERQNGFDLAQLATLDTPDTRRLLDLLTEAQAVAERIDAARGHALPGDLPLQAGESRGTDLAESVSMLAARLRGEIFGVGSGRE